MPTASVANKVVIMIQKKKDVSGASSIKKYVRRLWIGSEVGGVLTVVVMYSLFWKSII